MARATALAILALEESDKVRRLLLLSMGKGNARKEWEAFRRHGPKLAASLSLLTHGKYSLFSRKWASIPPKTPSDWVDLPHIAEMLRERCLFADLLSDGTWSVPSRMIPPSLCKAIIAMAAFYLGLTTTIALGAEMVVAGQLEPMPGHDRPDFSDASERGKRWLRWRMGKAGQAWGARELARHVRWVEGQGERMKRIGGTSRSRPKRKTSFRRKASA